MKILLFIIIVLVLLTIFISIYFSRVVTLPVVRNYNDTYSTELAAGNIKEYIFNKLEKEEVSIPSRFGYDLHGFFFPNGGSKKVIIFAHGITWSLYGSAKYMDIFIKRGFAVLIYDHRNHGLSGGKDTSFGYYEKYDLKTCTDWVIEKIGDDALIGVHGESMGGGTVLQYIAIDPRVSFCIDDCGYSDTAELFNHRLKNDFKPLRHLPLVPLASVATKITRGWKFSDVKPINMINKNSTPILFIHGDKDDYVPTKMSHDLYNAKTGFKDIYIAPNAGHAQAFTSNPYEYERRVDKFLKDLKII
ncbi:alpha/beta hydrolase [Clostridium manihotivorum]|uniref:Alpha/beta hydrolase n=1 Tax=Clostridium manihotivorum TaxID=2320868 RepID=A0A410DMD6_9CLOT|nr:alpha/beta hydrolase [Clostridium manihotivorum]QAA30223.1 alpha/beta hydrolase [Clostridium manihotivorum]